MSIRTELHENIAELDARIEALKADAKPLRDQVSNIDRTIGKLNAERAEHVNRLMELNEKPRVSDHAVIRYLERKHGFTFEDVRAELLTPAVVQAMDAGADGIKLNGGTLKLKGRTVVTYVEQRP